MIYLDLFLGFLRVGCFAFGGAYGAIPLIRDVVISYGWLSEDALTYMIAVSESTPGPIMVNLATYVGSNQGGFLGAIVATIAVVFPSFLIILLVMGILKNLWKNKYVQAVLRGLKPCIVGIILATGAYMTVHHAAADIPSVILTILLAMLMFGSRMIRKKKLSPILLITISAGLGVVFYGI